MLSAKDVLFSVDLLSWNFDFFKIFFGVERVLELVSLAFGFAWKNEEIFPIFSSACGEDTTASSRSGTSSSSVTASSVSSFLSVFSLFCVLVLRGVTFAGAFVCDSSFVRRVVASFPSSFSNFLLLSSSSSSNNDTLIL